MSSLVMLSDHRAYHLDKAFSENEKEQSGNIPALSSQVGMTGFKPAGPIQILSER